MCVCGWWRSIFETKLFIGKKLIVKSEGFKKSDSEKKVATKAELKREIKEEIGVNTKKIVKLTTYCPVPGYSDEIVHVYYAEVEKIKLKTLFI